MSEGTERKEDTGSHGDTEQRRPFTFLVLEPSLRSQKLRTHGRIEAIPEAWGTAQRLRARHRMLIDATFNVITGQILEAAIEVHRTLGPGLLESTYMPCLQYELTARKLRFANQRTVPIVYKGILLDTSYRIDLVVEDVVVVEVKSVAVVLAVHQAQVLTYMRLTRCPAGLLINFNVPKLMDGVKRLLNPHAVNGG